MTLKSGAIDVGEGGKVKWNEDLKFETMFSDVRDYAITGNLYLVNNAFVWSFPAKIFSRFEQVYILTYLFDGQIQRYYYDLHNIKYQYCAVVKEGDRYELKEKSDVIEDRTNLKELIHIYEGKFNEIGKNKKSLSKSWFLSSKNSDNVKRLKNNLQNYFKNVLKASADRILWTTFKDQFKKLKGKGFSKLEPDNNANSDVGQACFTSFNLRATNKYRYKNVLAFCLNRFMNPIEEHFFIQQNVKVDQDLLALSDLLQWIFRSAVREGKPVHIYVPSRRMRDLLKKWLNNEI